VYGRVTSARMSRTPDQRIYSSGDYSAYGFTQCYVGMSPPDSADFAFAKCDADGNFQLDNVPTGDYKLTVFDQWNDLLVDGLVSPVHVGTSGAGSSATNPMLPVTQWRTNCTRAPSSTQVMAPRAQRAMACRSPTSRACRWWRPTSAIATAASRSSTTPTWTGMRASTRSSRS